MINFFFCCFGSRAPGIFFSHLMHFKLIRLIVFIVSSSVSLLLTYFFLCCFRLPSCCNFNCDYFILSKHEINWLCFSDLSVSQMRFMECMTCKWHADDGKIFNFRSKLLVTRLRVGAKFLRMKSSFSVEFSCTTFQLHHHLTSWGSFTTSSKIRQQATNSQQGKLQCIAQWGTKYINQSVARIAHAKCKQTTSNKQKRTEEWKASERAQKKHIAQSKVENWMEKLQSNASKADNNENKSKVRGKNELQR